VAPRRNEHKSGNLVSESFRPKDGSGRALSQTEAPSDEIDSILAFSVSFCTFIFAFERYDYHTVLHVKGLLMNCY
jgi:hypothetical protein